MYAATPRPAASARPSAAPTSTPSGAGTGTVDERRVGSHTSANEIAASIQPRAAQTRREPVAIASGTAAAATSPQATRPVPAGPVWKWRTLPSDKGCLGSSPSVAASAPNSDANHGRSKSAPITRPATPTMATRPASAAPPTNGTVSTTASTSTAASSRAGGQMDAATAVSSPMVTTACRRRARSVSDAAATTSA